MSQADVAKAGGVNQSTVSRWLHYKSIAGIALETMVRLETALQIPPGWLTDTDHVPSVQSQDETPMASSTVRVSMLPPASVRR